MREKQGKIEYNLNDMEPVYPVPVLNLPGIEETECYKPKDGSPYIVFLCQGTRWTSERACPKCGSINLRHLGYTPERRLVHDVNCGVTQVDIFLKVDRYHCQDCDKTFVRPFPAIRDDQQMTERLYDQIRREAFRLPFVEVGAMYGYSDTTIANIFDEYAEELEAKRGVITAPRVLGIDEKHIVHAMRGIFVNVETGQLLEMTANNKKRDIIDTIMAMDGNNVNIEIVTMDMANHYKSYIEEVLPYAMIVVDKYHVYQDLYQKIRKTKTALIEYTAQQIKQEVDRTKREHLENVRNLVAKDSYLFKYSMANLAQKPERLAAMAELCRTFPEFNHLRLLKEGFECIYACGERSDAEAVYASWCDLVPPVGVKKIEAWEAKYHVPAELYAEFRSFKNAMTSWNNEVFNYFNENCGFTNAAAEGTNSLIQSMNSAGSGYSFKRLRAKALFWHMAAPRAAYSFDKKSIKKERKVKKPSNPRPSGGIAFVNPTKFLDQYETYFEEAEMIVTTQECKEYKPVSVLDYYEKARKFNPEGFID